MYKDFFKFYLASSLFKYLFKISSQPKCWQTPNPSTFLYANSGIDNLIWLFKIIQQCHIYIQSAIQRDCVWGTRHTLWLMKTVSLFFGSWDETSWRDDDKLNAVYNLSASQDSKNSDGDDLSQYVDFVGYFKCMYICRCLQNARGKCHIVRIL